MTDAFTVNEWGNPFGIRSPAFLSQGLCAQADPETWFPEKGMPDRARYAKATCGRCEVRLECLQYALDNAEPHGIWGGLTAKERKRVMRRAA